MSHNNLHNLFSFDGLEKQAKFKLLESIGKGTKEFAGKTKEFAGRTGEFAGRTGEFGINKAKNKANDFRNYVTKNPLSATFNAAGYVGLPAWTMRSEYQNRNKYENFLKDRHGENVAENWRSNQGNIFFSTLTQSAPYMLSGLAGKSAIIGAGRGIKRFQKNPPTKTQNGIGNTVGFLGEIGSGMYGGNFISNSDEWRSLTPENWKQGYSTNTALKTNNKLQNKKIQSTMGDYDIPKWKQGIVKDKLKQNTFGSRNVGGYDFTTFNSKRSDNIYQQYAQSPNYDNVLNQFRAYKPYVGTKGFEFQSMLPFLRHIYTKLGQ